MTCPHCQSSTKKFGRTSDGRQRYRCLTCRKVTAEAKERLLPGTRVPDDRTLMVLQLLCEGASVRAVERLTGTEKRTVLRLLKRVGEGCERMMADVVKDVPVKDVECDEIWSFVRCKEATKKRKAIQDLEAGDCYCFTALERGGPLPCYTRGYRAVEMRTARRVCRPRAMDQREENVMPVESNGSTLFDDLLAAAMLYVDSWENVNDGDGIGQAYALLKDELRGSEELTSRERERVFRDAPIREACRRGEAHADVGNRYGLSPSAVSAIARAAGLRRRSGRKEAA